MYPDSRNVPPLRGGSWHSAAGNATHGTGSARRRVLVVDDDVTLEEVLIVFLGEAYEISAATTGAEALRKVCHEPTHLVVLDHRLPDRTGLEVLTELRSTWPSLPVLMLTGYGSEWICAAAFRLGVTDYLQKPVDAAGLVEVVHRISFEHLDRRRLGWRGRPGERANAPTETSRLPGAGRDCTCSPRSCNKGPPAHLWITPPMVRPLKKHQARTRTRVQGLAQLQHA